MEKKLEKNKKTDKLRSIGKQSRESVESVTKKLERICRKGRFYADGEYTIQKRERQAELTCVIYVSCCCSGSCCISRCS